MENANGFYAKYASSKTKAVTTVTLVAAFTAGATNLVDLLFGDIIAIVSIAFYLVAAFAFLYYKNWMLPLVITIYSSFFSFMIFEGITFIVGIVNIITGLLGLIKVRKVNVEYEIYRKSGNAPNSLI